MSAPWFVWKARWQKAIRLLARPRLWKPVLRHRVLPSLEHADLPLPPDLATVFDVGAHHGQFALLVHNAFPSADIVCFEPLANSREILGQVTGNWARVEPVALAAEGGKAPFHVSALTDSSSLRKIGRTQIEAFPGTATSHVEDVKVETLRQYIAAGIRRPSLLKIDVQGTELEVLHGAGEFLSNFDLIFVECSFVELYEGQHLAADVVAYLQSCGYRLADVRGVSRRGTAALQADFLFRAST